MENIHESINNIFFAFYFVLLINVNNYDTFGYKFHSYSKGSDSKNVLHWLPNIAFVSLELIYSSLVTRRSPSQQSLAFLSYDPFFQL